MLEAQTQTEKQQWEALVSQFPEANFLQSYNWGAFQARLSKHVIRRVVVAGEQGGQPALYQAIKEVAKRGTYLTVAGGPLVDWQNVDAVRAVFADMLQTARQERCHFIRFRPQVIDSPELRRMGAQLGWREAPMHVTADLTLQLDLTQSEDELLAQMRKNHRYMIRKAERDGVRTVISTDQSEMELFYKHQVSLAQKHQFVPFSREFLLEQFSVFAADNQAALIHAYHGEELLASAMIIFYNQEAVYHYGISTDLNATFPGSYAAQWAAILEAKKRGCTRYNFWGIAPADQPQHRFAGVSLFKRGFGGQEVAYLPAHDVVTSAWYWITYLFEIMRKRARHL